MKTLALLLSLFSFNSFSESLIIETTISPWVSDCNDPEKCNIPRASHSPVKIKLYIKELYEPQTGDFIQEEFSIGKSRLGTISAYSVYPKIDSGLPPYIQFQFTQNLPSYLLCSHSIKLRSPMTVPPLICASSHEGINLGYTITFKRVDN